jgi:outer membrane protein assembly factor BamB
MKSTRIRLAAALLSLLAGAAMINAADWPRFRGPNGTGTADDKNIPAKWTEANYLFKTELPGKGHSSPIVSKGKLFLQSSSDDAKERYLICVDAKSGKIDWAKPVAAKLARTHQKNSMSSCTPAADGERIYAIFWEGQDPAMPPKKDPKVGPLSTGNLVLIAFDYSGSEKWRQELGLFTSQHGPGMSPIVVGDKVIVNDDQDGKAELMAFDAKTGKPVWTRKRDHERACYSTPFLLEKTDAGPELLVVSTGGITGYDPKDGTEIWNYVWKFDRMRLRTVGSAILHQGTIFAISGDGGGDRNMIALKPGTKGEVPVSNLVWKKTTGTAYVPTPVAKDGLVFWVTDKEGLAVCVDAKTGGEVWNERLGGGAEISASMVMIDGKIFVINEKGTVFVYPAAREFQLMAKNELNETVFATPAVADGRLYIRGAKHLFCIGTK